MESKCLEAECNRSQEKWKWNDVQRTAVTFLRRQQFQKVIFFFFKSTSARWSNDSHAHLTTARTRCALCGRKSRFEYLLRDTRYGWQWVRYSLVAASLFNHKSNAGIEYVRSTHSAGVHCIPSLIYLIDCENVFREIPLAGPVGRLAHTRLHMFTIESNWVEQLIVVVAVAAVFIAFSQRWRWQPRDVRRDKMRKLYLFCYLIHLPQSICDLFFACNKQTSVENRNVGCLCGCVRRV